MRGALALLLAAGCAGPAGQRVLARGVLAYDVAAAGELVATIELETEFALVLRRPGAVARAALGPHDRDMVDVAADGSGGRVAVAGLDGTVRLHDGLTGRETARWRLDEAATAVALSGDGAWLITGAASGLLCLRRTTDGALLQCVAEHGTPLRALAIAGTALASGDDAGQLVTWELPSLRTVARQQTGRAITAVALSPSGRLAVAHAPIRALAWAGDELCSAGSDGRLVVGAHEVGRFGAALRGLAVAGPTLYVAGFTTGDLRGPSLTAVRLP